MEDRFEAVLEEAFPGQSARFFLPMAIGGTPAAMDEGAALILAGTKTATSSPFWDYPDGKIPFLGALCVLVDGQRRPRGILETTRIRILRLGDVDEALARDYGEGERTLAWWRREIGGWYRESGARHGIAVTDDTEIIAEWFAVVRRF